METKPLTLTPKVSIIVPVYNAQETIAKCVDSILDQTFDDFELLLINDGSKDDSLSLLKTFESQDARIVVVDKENEGVAVTRNKALLMARGHYVMFMDNDDFIDKDYVEVFYQKISQDRLDIVVGGYRRVTENRVLFEVSLSTDDWSKYTIISPWAKIYKKSFLVENHIQFLDYILGEDVYFNLQAYSKTDKIQSIAYVGYNWYDNEVSVSNTAHKGFRSEADILYLFNQLQNVISFDDDMMKYYLKRLFIYYLLYSGRTATSEEFMRQYNRGMKWFQDNALQTSISALDRRVQSERLSAKLALIAFECFQKMKLLPMMARFYCRG